MVTYNFFVVGDTVFGVVPVFGCVVCVVLV